MSTPMSDGIRKFLKNRTAVVAAASAGFLIGAAGFAAAEGGVIGGADDSTATIPSSVASTLPDATTPTTAPATDPTTAPSTDPATTAPATDPTTAPSTDPATTAPATDPGTTGPTTSVEDDATSTSVEDEDETGDDSTSTSVEDDEDNAAVEAFTKTYTSAGGSITVTWDGSRLTLDAVTPNAGFSAQVEEQSSDRVRVDFESDEGNSGSGNNESRIEVRVHNGEVREEIEG